MTLNCPSPFGVDLECNDCSCRSDFDRFKGDMCNYYILNPVPIRDILTAKEYIDYLDKNNINRGGIYKGGDFGKRDEFLQIKGQVLYLQSKLNEHIDKAKRRAKNGF